MPADLPLAAGVDAPRVAAGVDAPRVAAGVDAPRVAAGVDAPRVAAGVDVGGTFTDVVLLAGHDAPWRAVKVPTTPDNQSHGVVGGLREAGRPVVDVLAHGTTTATNAVLEGRVARTVFVTTEGFRDLLVIGRQERPSLYDLRVVRPAPLVPQDLVVTVRERMGADGRAVVPLDAAEVARVVDAVRRSQPESVAVSLLFAYANPAHERVLCDALASALAVPVTRSSDLLPEFREYERASTCVLNAAVAPVMRRYLAQLSASGCAATVAVMTSGGGWVPAPDAAAQPVHTLLSGPAAGVVAAAGYARAAGFPDAVAFDMGGTSTDVCLIRDGAPAVGSEGWIGGFPFRTPAVDVHTVGAGGGSIAEIDAGGALRVGPRSAGAQPGPAAYGRGGTEPTVTDAHVVLGHLDAFRGLGGRWPLDADAAERAVGALRLGGDGAAGIVRVVQATMARAVRRVTTERGVDPRGLALVAYGGAGPLHATAVAREVGCRAVVVPPAPGVLSAVGLLLAPPRRERSRTVAAPADADLTAPWRTLADEAEAWLHDESGSGAPRLRWIADCRYRGQSHELRIAVDAPGAPLATRFSAAHEQAYGYALDDEPVEVVTLRVVAEGDPLLAAPPSRWDHGGGGEVATRMIGTPDGTVRAPVVPRGSLRPGDTVAGLCIVEQPDATTLLLPGDAGVATASGSLVVHVGG